MTDLLTQLELNARTVEGHGGGMMSLPSDIVAKMIAVAKLAYELMQKDVHGVGRHQGEICDDLITALAALTSSSEKAP